jgi:hypothetical protein
MADREGGFGDQGKDRSLELVVGDATVGQPHRLGLAP